MGIKKFLRIMLHICVRSSLKYFTFFLSAQIIKKIGNQTNHHLRSAAVLTVKIIAKGDRGWQFKPDGTGKNSDILWHNWSSFSYETVDFYETSKYLIV